MSNQELLDVLRVIVDQYVPVRDLRGIEHMPLQSPVKTAAVLAARRALATL